VQLVQLLELVALGLVVPLWVELLVVRILWVVQVRFVLLLALVRLLLVVLVLLKEEEEVRRNLLLSLLVLSADTLVLVE